MIRIFFLRQKSTSPGDDSQTNKPTRLDRLYRAAQTVFATKLGRCEQQLNQIQRKFAFFLFCLILGGLSTAWIVQGLFFQPKKGPAYLHQSTVTIPRDARLPDSLDLNLLKEIRRQQRRPQSDSTKH